MSVLLIPAVLLGLICVWTVIPPFNGFTIILAAVSIELSVYLVVNLLFLVTLWKARRMRVAARDEMALRTTTLRSIVRSHIWATPYSL